MRALRAEGGADGAARIRVPGPGGDRPRRAFLRLGARLNFHRMYEDAIAGFNEEAVARRQASALEAVGLPNEAKGFVGST